MIKQFNGERYDTDIAELLAAIDNGLPSTDPRFESDDLYHTKRGTFFLHLTHGPESDAAYANQRYFWNEVIVPLTINEAQAWAKQHLKQEAISQIFGGNPGSSMTQMEIEIPAATAYKMKCKAAAKSMTVSELIDHTLPL